MNAYALFALARRNIKVFLKDKANVFFSLLAPLIVLALYALFLGRVQTDGILAALAEAGVTGGESAVRAFCDSWMLAGSVSCACITVPLCACGTQTCASHPFPVGCRPPHTSSPSWRRGWRSAQSSSPSALSGSLRRARGS